MTTIKIKNTEQLSRTNFQDLEDLQDFLLSLQLENEFSEVFKKEIDLREEEVLTGKVKTISWSEVSSKI